MKHRVGTAISIVLWLVLLLTSTISFSRQAPISAPAEKVTLQLKWFHQFQFAGFYAAKEQGYYAEEGLDVDILERSLDKDIVKQVTSGEVDFAIGDSGISSYYARGEPIIALAAIFQHNPLVFITKQSTGIISSYEMQGKKVMFDSVGAGDAPLRAILAEADSYTLIKQSFNADDLINDKVDVMSAYLSNEPFYFKEKGIKINIINPQSYGFDFYGDILFTSQQQVSCHPERVEKFRRASLKGWQYALDHPEQLIQLIHQKYHSELSLAHLRFEAEITRKLMLPDSIPLGQLNVRRFKKVADVYAHLNFSRPLTENELANFIYTSQSLDLTEQEQAWLKAHPVIHVGIDKNFAPYEWLDEQGGYVGLVADYIALFERKLGVKFSLIKDKTWAETLAMARNNQLDILSAVQETPERSQFLNFTLPYTSNSIIIINNKQSGFIGSLSGLNGKRVAIEKGYFMEELLKQDYPAMSVVPVDTSKEALTQVAIGKIDAYVGDAAAANYVMQTIELSNLQFSGTTAYSSAYSLAIVKTHPELTSIMMKVIATIPAIEHERIKNHWMSLKISNGIDIKTVYQYALCILFIVLFFVVWNVRLRREVTRRETIEQQLRTLTVAIEQSPASVVITDLNAILQYVNPQFTEVTGYSAAEVIGKNPRVLQSGLTTKETFNQLWIILTQGEIWHGELINRRKNGEVYWEDVHIAPVKDSAGITTHYVGVKLDISERKQIEQRLKESESQYRNTFEYAPIGIVNVSLVLRFLSVNQTFCDMLGYSRAELLILSVMDITQQQDKQAHELLIQQLLSGEKEFIRLEKQYVRKDGSLLWGSLSVRLSYTAKGIPEFFIVTVENINQRKQIEAELKKRHFELQQYFNQPFIGMMTFNHDKKTIAVNQCFCDMVGYTQAEMQIINWGEITHPDDLALNQLYLEQAIRGEIDSYQMEKRYIHKDGHLVYVDLAVNCVRLPNGEPNYFIGMTQDITERKAIEEEIKQLAFYDPLTGLPNRRKLLDRLQYAIALNHRTNNQFAVFMMDLDKFKAVNDRLGHAAGDALLKQVALRITNCLRDSDMVARLGGDEFVLVLENLKTLEDAETIALKVIADLTVPFQLSDNDTVQIGASIGISIYPKHGNTPEILMDHADTALYQAKECGRGCFAYFSEVIATTGGFN